MSSQTCIEFRNVTKRFGSKTILENFSVTVERGEILFILGKSGMGKSVTLKHIIGLLRPDAGEITVLGEPVGQASPEKLSEIRSRCGMVFQHPALLDSLSVYHNISFGLRTPQFKKRFRQWSEAEIHECVLQNLDRVHLPKSIVDKMPPELSYGMQKRVSLARTLAPKPEILLFDEPTTGLDPVTTTTINELIYELSRELNVTSLVVSHDMACALKVADRILFLDGGGALSLGTVPETLQNPHPVVRDFLDEAVALLDDESRAHIWGRAK